MRVTMRLALMAALVMSAVLAVAQAQKPLKLDDLVGVWNMTYLDGQGQTGKFTISKNADGTPKVSVSTVFGDSEARNIVIEGDTITFIRDLSIQGVASRVNYKATLRDGKLEGSAVLTATPPPNSGSAQGPGPTPTPFSATKVN